MPFDSVIFLSIPALRRRDLAHMPRLSDLAATGSSAPLIPSFPCVTSSVQANVLTGKPPQEHGIIANGFYHRDRKAVELWVGRNGLFLTEQLWDRLQRRGITQAAWMTQNIKDAPADFIVTPEPIHHPDGRMDLWCYSKPDRLYETLLADLGHFPLMNYWGPMAGIASTRWIVNAALWLLQRERPRFNHLYIPHLDYAAQKFGPDSPQQAAACKEADQEIGRLIDGATALKVGNVLFLAAGEYALTNVSRVVYPNRILRDAGLARISHDAGAEHLDVAASTAFAVVDHQLAHVYVQNGGDTDAVAGLFEGVPGVAAVRHGSARRALGVDHPRSGEVVLVSEPDAWFAYYWWHDDAKAPRFARTVDIHAKPGYDPVELFFDPATKSIPLDATLVKGSHGAPAQRPEQHCICIASLREVLPPTATIQDLDLAAIVERSLA